MLLAVLGATLLAPSTAAADPPPGACVLVRAEARYGAGDYDHIVHLANDCAQPVVCAVRTDVNPTPIEVRIAPATSTDVLTFRGSPAHVFVPTVDCRIDAPPPARHGRHSHHAARIGSGKTPHPVED